MTLDTAVAALTPSDVQIAVRLIFPGDEDALAPGERPDLDGARVERRRQSGAARDLARGLLEPLVGVRPILPRSVGGGPLWPEGVVGSLAHDRQVALAAVAPAALFAGIGVDVEPFAPLPGRLAAKIATEGERRRGLADPAELRVLLSVKEAVYKATHPGDGLFLGFQDVEVDLAEGLARTSTGRTLQVAVARSPRILALAFIRRHAADDGRS